MIDNFSRRILAERLNDRFDPGTSTDLVVKTGRGLDGDIGPPMLLADAGVENRNRTVDELIESGLLHRVLAMTEIGFSDSLIEARWRSLKHNCLFLNQLDFVARVRRLVEFHVEEHNTPLPHSAFRGQTQDETYFSTGTGVPDKLAAAKQDASRRRLEVNRAARCAVCLNLRTHAALAGLTAMAIPTCPSSTRGACEVPTRSRLETVAVAAPGSRAAAARPPLPCRQLEQSVPDVPTRSSQAEPEGDP